VHADPNREHTKYNFCSFRRHCKNIQERWKAFDQFGTGLDNQKFRDLVAIRIPPSAEEQAGREYQEALCHLEEGSDDDNDSDYCSAGQVEEDEEDDLTLESALKNFNLNGNVICDVDIPLSPAKNPNPEVRTRKKAKAQEKEEEDNNKEHTPAAEEAMVKTSTVAKTKKMCRAPVVCVHPDKERILVVFEIDGGVAINEDWTKIEIAEDGKHVQLFAKVHNCMTDAAILLGGSGFTNKSLPQKDEDVSALAAYLKDVEKNSKRDENNDVWQLREEVSLNFEVERTFFDKHGRPTNDFTMDTNSNYFWAYCWLRGTHAEDKKPMKRGGRLVNNPLQGGVPPNTGSKS
jgi:hypothetical protein